MGAVQGGNERAPGGGGRGVSASARSGARAVLSVMPLGFQTAVRRFRNQSRKLPEMSIGLLCGDSPWELDAPSWGRSPILVAHDVLDVNAAFVADPFGVRVDDEWHLFFEVMNRDSGKGDIALAQSRDLVDWQYRGVVLSESFHLSYPAIYVDRDAIWMIPETWESGQVRLYRATSFPNEWALERVLLDGVAGTDPTLYQEGDGTWNMLLCSAGRRHNQTLLRFEAPYVTGPWKEEPGGPLIVGDPSSARPGGHCFFHNGTPYRLGQDCSKHYGERLRSYPLSAPWNVGGKDVLAPTGSGWRGRGGHHADFHLGDDGKYFAFVDGEA